MRETGQGRAKQGGRPALFPPLRRKDKEWGSVVTEKWAPASRAREMDQRAIRAGCGGKVA